MFLILKHNATERKTFRMATGESNSHRIKRVRILSKLGVKESIDVKIKQQRLKLIGHFLRRKPED